jgi:hypothetical protein
MDIFCVEIVHFEKFDWELAILIIFWSVKTKRSKKKKEI